MYAGRVVEIGDVVHDLQRAAASVHRRAHGSLPRLGRGRRTGCEPIPGQPPSLSPAAGLRVPPALPRCRRAASAAARRCRRCATSASAAHVAACHFAEELELSVPAVGARRRAARDRERDAPQSADAAVAAARARAATRSSASRASSSTSRSRPGVFKHTVGQVRAVDGVDLDVHRGRDARHRRRVRLRQDDARPDDHQAAPSRRRARSSSTAQDITTLKRKQMRPVRRDLQIVFQDPYASLNPRMTVREIVAEPLRSTTCTAASEGRRTRRGAAAHGRPEPRARATATRTSSPAASASGSASPARSRSNPELIVLDEPVSALDVSIQAQVVNLLGTLQNEFGLTYLFIAHDLSVVRHISDRVAVMYLGKIVEVGTRRARSTTTPMHPYTQALLSAVPIESPNQRRQAAADHARRATCRALRIRRLGAGSARAAGRRRRSARRRSRRSSPRGGAGHPVACHFAEVMRPLALDEDPSSVGRRARSRSARRAESLPPNSRRLATSNGHETGSASRL